MNRYATEVLESLKRKYPWEEEFIQSVTEVVGSLSEVLDQNPNYKK